MCQLMMICREIPPIKTTPITWYPISRNRTPFGWVQYQRDTKLYLYDVMGGIGPRLRLLFLARSTQTPNDVIEVQFCTPLVLDLPKRGAVLGNRVPRDECHLYRGETYTNIHHHSHTANFK